MNKELMSHGKIHSRLYKSWWILFWLYLLALAAYMIWLKGLSIIPAIGLGFIISRLAMDFEIAVYQKVMEADKSSDNVTSQYEDMKDN